jgi:hypothetical protein
MGKPLPSADYLRACLDYDPYTGELCWKARPQNHFVDARACSTWNARFNGKLTGRIDRKSDYKRYLVFLDYRPYKAHRLIWKMMTGNDPPSTIDHKDGNEINNRWDNLRLATQQQQLWNAACQKRSISGKRGVYPNRGKWMVQIDVNGRRIFLGRFTVIEEAVAAYEAAARKLHGEFYRNAIVKSG